MMSRLLAVIPARGGSKGIPRKNLAPVGGRPLLVWTIEQALATRYAAGGRLDVLVSTDDPEIADVARSAGALVLDRPAELAADTTPTEPVVRHAVQARRAAGAGPEAVLLLQATSPIRLPGTLDRAIEQFETTGVDSLVGVVPTPIYLWAPGAQPEDPPAALYPWQARPRRQELRAAQVRYRETGSIYVSRTELYDPRRAGAGPIGSGAEHPDSVGPGAADPGSLGRRSAGVTSGNRLGGRIGLFVMAEVEGIDIDEPVDLAVADATMRWLAGHAAGSG